MEALQPTTRESWWSTCGVALRMRKPEDPGNTTPPPSSTLPPNPPLPLSWHIWLKSKFVDYDDNILFMAPHLVRAQSAYKDIYKDMLISSHTHTHTHTHTHRKKMHMFCIDLLKSTFVVTFCVFVSCTKNVHMLCIVLLKSVVVVTFCVFG